MCSRFELNTVSTDLTDCFGLDELPDGFRQGEIRPTNYTLCVGPLGPFVKRWGLKVYWDNKPLINARAETLTRKHTFKPLLNSRCLVPASAYFEWRREQTARCKNKIVIPDLPLFSFAGLTDGENVIIVTCQSIPSISHIHSRMPVILFGDDKKKWIDDDLNYEDIAELVLPQADLGILATEEAKLPPQQGSLFD